MEENLKILFISSEIKPFSGQGELSSVAGNLPKAIKTLGHEIRVVTPRYLTIRERKHGLREVARLKSVQILIGEKTIECSVKSGFLTGSKAQVYFIENPKYFSKPIDLLMGDDGKTNTNVHLGLALLNHAALQLMMLLEWIPDIIHCNGWQTSFVPHLLRENERYTDKFESTRTLLAVNDIHTSRCLPGKVADEIGVNGQDEKRNKQLYHKGDISFLKAGLSSADLVVSSDLKESIKLLKKDGLHGRLSVKAPLRETCFSIPNGHDVDKWNPATDAHLKQNYSSEDLNIGKHENKTYILNELKFDETTDKPLVVVSFGVSELDELGRIEGKTDSIFKLDCNFIVICDDSKTPVERLKRKINLDFENVRIVNTDNNELLHQTYAGSDLLILLSDDIEDQILCARSFSYATVPVAPVIGMNSPLVVESSGPIQNGTGFTFKKVEIPEVVKALKRAVKAYNEQLSWREIQLRGMNSDFSWWKIADIYTSKYMEALSNPPFTFQ